MEHAAAAGSILVSYTCNVRPSVEAQQRIRQWVADGGRWVAERLLELREPKFRPQRAGEGTWRVTDFDPSAPAALRR